MNDRLKFRAWLDQERKMVYQEVGETMESFMRKYANCYLMQFTGIYAVNHQEIYENDIVRDVENDIAKDPDRTNPIFDTPLIDVTWESTQFYNGWSLIDSKYECLGNLYENPDLILALYNRANEKLSRLDKELDIATNRIRELNDKLALTESMDVPYDNEEYNTSCAIDTNANDNSVRDCNSSEEACYACNCFRNSATCCNCNSETTCCATGFEAEVDFGDSNDCLDAMAADPNWECNGNVLKGTEAEAGPDPDNILEPLEESDRGALILLMRNISNLREENAALKLDVKNPTQNQLQLLKVITGLKAENTKLLREVAKNNY